jgi:large subunit ribosomal protein L9
MHVILLEDVPNVGKKYEEHEVADGYGTNYLLPNGLARVATDRTRAQLKKKKEQVEKKRQQKREEKLEKLAEIAGQTVSITAKTGDQGQLFAGIYPEDIAEAINEAFADIDLSTEDIDRDQPLQKVGEYDVAITILEETKEVTVNVESE